MMRGEIARRGDRSFEPCGKSFEHRGETRFMRHLIRRQGDQNLPARVIQHIVAGNPALPLGRTPLAEGDQAGKAAIGGAVRRQAQKTRSRMFVRRVEIRREIKARAGYQADITLPRGDMGAHHTGQTVAVGECHRLVAKRRRPLDKLLGMRGAAQKTVIARHLQFGISAHASNAHASSD